MQRKRGLAAVRQRLKPGLQYTQETGAKPRDFARTQAKKCLQSMRVCLQIFPACVTSQLVAQTTTESDHSFTVEFTTLPVRKKTKWRWHAKRKVALVFRFRPLLCLCFFSFLFLFFSLFLQIPIAAKIIEKLRHMQYLDFKIRYEVVRAPSPWKLDYLKNKRANNRVLRLPALIVLLTRRFDPETRAFFGYINAGKRRTLLLNVKPARMSVKTKEPFWPEKQRKKCKKKEEDER